MLVSVAVCVIFASSMRRRVWVGLVGALVGFNLLVGYQVLVHSAGATTEDPGYGALSVFTRALQLVRQDYVDEKRVDYRNLTYSALKGMLASLDPHSQFMEPADYRDMRDETRSEFGGLGIVVSTKDGIISIVTPMEDSPSFRAGILPGDQILRINGLVTDRMKVQDALQLLRGDPGQKVTLTIYRPSTKETKEYTLQREIIKVSSVKDTRLLDPSLAGKLKIGYARIVQFNEPTAQELDHKLDELEHQGMQALILDLRFNPGGLLNSAVDVCGLFLPPHSMVVYTEGRDAAQQHEYYTSRTAKARTLPLVLLVNGESASAAEIVAGALKDLNRAALVGETTFGKGSVQSVIQLPDGSALRLTTARYFTPSRQVIHEKGVTPTISSTLSPDEEKGLLLRHREGALTPSEQDLAKNQPDDQLNRAVDAIKSVLTYSANQPAASGTER